MRGAFARGIAAPRGGSANPNWRGGRAAHTKGYVLLHRPEHPRAHKSRPYVYEHILVAEEKLGRPLQPGELVHHMNHVKDDNRPENLQVLTQGEHMRLHWQENRAEWLQNLARARGC